MVCNLCSFQKTIACHFRIAYVKDIFELGIIQCMVNVILVNLSFLTTTQKHLSAEILVTSSFLINNYRNIFKYHALNIVNPDFCFYFIQGKK